MGTNDSTFHIIDFENGHVVGIFTDGSTNECSCGERCRYLRRAELDPDHLRCGICGEALRWESPYEEAAEMYDPTKPDEPSVVCHGQCGIDRGLQVA